MIWSPSNDIVIINMDLSLGLSAVAPPGVYYVRVFAQNAFGTSAPSNEVIVTVPGPVP